VNVAEFEEKIAQSSKAERLQMMELLWDAIRTDAPESPEWHGEILAERLAKSKAGKAEFLTISELKERVGR
jgi:hypothetical protein